MRASRWTVCGLAVWTLWAAVDVREAWAQTCVPPPAGLVGWWPGNATAFDAVTGTGAQLAGDATYVPGAVGRAFKLDGVGDYVEIPDAPALKPTRVTVEAWVRFDNLNSPDASRHGLQYVVFKRNSRLVNFEGYALRKERSGSLDRFAFSIADVNGFGGANVAYSTTPITVGRFYHVVGSYDGAAVRIYVDGVLEGQSAVSVALDYGTRPVFLGATNEAWEGKTNGVIDEASIYSRALASAEVSGLYAAGAAGKCAVQLNVPPTILTQPAGVMLLPGQATTLTVAATGTAPLTFQWYVGASGTTTSPIDGATSPAYTTPAVSASTSYWVRVSNAVATTDSAAAVVTPLPIVGQPTGLYVKSLSGNTVTLAWRDSPGQLPVTGHVLEGGIPGNATPLGAVETGSGAPVFSITVPNGSFWVQMRARSGSTLGAPSAQIPVCLNSGCPPPPPVDVLGLANGTMLSLGWRTPLETGLPSRLTLQVTGAVVGSVDLPGTAESFTFPTVPAGTFNFALVSCTAAGCSAPSAPVTLTFPGTCAGPPATPAGFVAGRSGTTLVLDWGLPASGSPPSSYLLSVSGAFVGSVPFTTRGVTGPVPAGTYTLTLAAVNPCGVSSPSSPLTITVP